MPEQGVFEKILHPWILGQLLYRPQVHRAQATPVPKQQTRLPVSRQQVQVPTPTRPTQLARPPTSTLPSATLPSVTLPTLPHAQMIGAMIARETQPTVSFAPEITQPVVVTPTPPIRFPQYTPTEPEQLPSLPEPVLPSLPPYPPFPSVPEPPPPTPEEKRLREVIYSPVGIKGLVSLAILAPQRAYEILSLIERVAPRALYPHERQFEEEWRERKRQEAEAEYRRMLQQREELARLKEEQARLENQRRQEEYQRSLRILDTQYETLKDAITNATSISDVLNLIKRAEGMPMPYRTHLTTLGKTRLSQLILAMPNKQEARRVIEGLRNAGWLPAIDARLLEQQLDMPTEDAQNELAAQILELEAGTLLQHARRLAPDNPVFAGAELRLREMIEQIRDKRYSITPEQAMSLARSFNTMIQTHIKDITQAMARRLQDLRTTFRDVLRTLLRPDIRTTDISRTVGQIQNALKTFHPEVAQAFIDYAGKAQEIAVRDSWERPLVVLDALEKALDSFLSSYENIPEFTSDIASMKLAIQELRNSLVTEMDDKINRLESLSDAFERRIEEIAKQGAPITYSQEYQAWRKEFEALRLATQTRLAGERIGISRAGLALRQYLGEANLALRTREVTERIARGELRDKISGLNALRQLRDALNTTPPTTPEGIALKEELDALLAQVGESLLDDLQNLIQQGKQASPQQRAQINQQINKTAQQIQKNIQQYQVSRFSQLLQKVGNWFRKACSKAKSYLGME